MPITPKHAPTFLFLLSLPITAACVGELEPTNPPGTQDPGGKTDYDGNGDTDGGTGDGGGTTTNPVPPSASATATVSDCAGGTSQTFSPDWEALTVLFDGNTVEPGRPIDCIVTIDYRYTAGWTFDVPHVDARGFRFLEDGARIDARLGATLGGAGGSVPDAWTGPINDDFYLRFDGGGGSAPCGATSARVVVRVTADASGAGGSFAVVDSLDSEIDWRQCP
jgi:hypothetical protein